MDRYLTIKFSNLFIQYFPVLIRFFFLTIIDAVAVDDDDDAAVDVDVDDVRIAAIFIPFILLPRGR